MVILWSSLYNVGILLETVFLNYFNIFSRKDSKMLVSRRPLLVLILGRSKTVKVEDYRPINLVNSVYKIIIQGSQKD